MNGFLNLFCFVLLYFIYFIINFVKILVISTKILFKNYNLNENFKINLVE